MAEDKTEEATATTAAAPAADALTEEDRKALESVKERLTFFFSDANVRQDRFIRKLLTEDEELGIPEEEKREIGVPVSTLLRFNTVKKLTEKPAVVIQAAKELPDILVVDDEKSLINRKVPFTDRLMKKNIPKSFYVKNLPLKDAADDNGENPRKVYDVEVDEIRSLFAKYGDVALVKFYFSADKTDKVEAGEKRKKRPDGAAMVEYQRKEDFDKAKRAILTIKDGEKVTPKDKLTLPPNESRKSPVDLEVLQLSEHIASCQRGKRGREEDEDDKEEEEEDFSDLPKWTIEWKPGCVIKMNGLPESCDREAISEMLQTALEVSKEDIRTRKIYIDFSRGQTDGAIRFPEVSDDIAKVAQRLKEGELKVGDSNVKEAYVLEGDEEKKYWESFIEFKNKQILQREKEKRERQRQQQKNKKQKFAHRNRGRR